MVSAVWLGGGGGVCIVGCELVVGLSVGHFLEVVGLWSLVVGQSAVSWFLPTTNDQRPTTSSSAPTSSPANIRRVSSPDYRCCRTRLRAPGPVFPRLDPCRSPLSGFH